MKKKQPVKVVSEGKLMLQLYVAGMSHRSMEAIQNIKTLCDEHLSDAFELEIIDIYKNPQIASEKHIVFSPSLIKSSPLPKRTLVGDLSDLEKVVKILGISFKDKQ